MASHPPSLIRLLRLATLLAGAHAAGAAAQAADDMPGQHWSFAGYGSAGVVHSSDRQSDFSSNVINPGRAGYTKRYSYDVDSRLAGQVNYESGADWSAVLQVISERNLDNDFVPKVEWANLRYRISPELSVRIGRTALPIFLLGDYRKASYALPWVRPPIEVYGGLPISNSDGVDVSYSWRAGGVKNVSQGSFGRTQVRTGNGSHATARQLVGVSNTTTTNNLTVRASVMTAALTVDIAKPLFDAFSQFGAPGTALAHRYDVAATRTSVAAIGFTYDPGSWFLMGETGRLNTRSYLGNKSVYYLSSGYRWRAFTPYVTYSGARSHQALSDPGLPVSSYPAALAPLASGLNAELNGLLRTITVQHTVSAGVRWDVARDYSLKVQYDRLRPEGQSNGSLINVQPGFRTADPVHVVSAMLDFVF
ncbi:hypothetical protein [Duganella sp. Leaf126]|uniref:hypothetical protein n=1 Tax=Duganella sp. Leaf126 TaxID=1736266 RepID=UPI001E3DFB7B|nr:hypothetical protein [Duganella sp. Leaf126]